MTLVPLPAFADHHIWMLQEGRDAIVVDPGDAKPVPDALERGDLQLAAILVTHHHHAAPVERIANFLDQYSAQCGARSAAPM
jgi:hydroxyacylglutathione hydrolase